MAQVPIEDLLKRCGSIYKLVILAAKRAKEIAQGSPALVETTQQKATSIALDEILQGKVLYKTEAPEAPAGKRGTRSESQRGKKKRAV